ncbi:hypothetical protein V2J09_007816 [Rumex salicifolius]
MRDKRNKKHSSLPILSWFTSRRAKSASHDDEVATPYWLSPGRKVYRSDEDKGLWRVAEPGIDSRASVFIARFHEARSTYEPPPHLTLQQNYA